MPWKFINPRDAEAVQRRQATLGRIEAWWAAFVERARGFEPILQRGEQASLHAWMRQHLLPVDPRLQWELGFDAEDGTHFLVITPGRRLHLRPMVDSLIRRAPAVPGWKFSAYRPPVGVDVAGRMVIARTGHIPGMAATVQPRIGAASRVDMVYQLRAATTDEDLARRQAEAFTAALLGEEVFDRWAGEVDVAAPSRTLGGMEKFIDLPRLRATVLNLGQAIIEQLPVRPYWQIPHKARAWTRFSHDPKNPVAGDFPFQSDLVDGKTVLAEMKPGWLAGGRVYSESFSRHGETLCYFKMDVSDLSQEKRVSERRKMENRMERELVKAKVGAVMGSGDGLRYAYVDLALVELPRAFEVIGDILRIVEIPTRSWLLFFDSELADEYIGLRPTTPPPPMPPDQVEPVSSAPARPASAHRPGPSPEQPEETGDAWHPDWLDPIDER
jgi:hypothetical protein